MGKRISTATKGRALLVARLLGSDSPGEAGSAICALNRLLPVGLTVEGIVTDALDRMESSESASGPPAPVNLRVVPSGGWMRCEWTSMAAACVRSPRRFEAFELTFLATMSTQPSEPTPKQWAWLRRLHGSLESAVAA